MADGHGLFDEPIDEALDAVPLVFEDAPRATLRVRHGVTGAMLAGALLAWRDLLEAPKDPSPVTVEAASEPGDLDADGIQVSVDGSLRAYAPALPIIQPDTRRPTRARAGSWNRARRQK